MFMNNLATIALEDCVMQATFSKVWCLDMFIFLFSVDISSDLIKIQTRWNSIVWNLKPPIHQVAFQNPQNTKTLFKGIVYRYCSQSMNTPQILKFFPFVFISNLNLKILNSHISLICSVKNPWVELTLENWLAKGECLRAYKHMVKLTFNLCGTLGL